MEKRAILAAMLMAGLLLVYQFLFVAPQDSKQAPAPQKAEAPPAPATTPSPPPAASSPPPPLPAKELPQVPERAVVVETPLYRAVIGSAGGAIQAWELRYRGNKPMVLPGVVSSQGLTVLTPGQPPRVLAFAIAGDSLKLDKERPEGELRLVGDDGFGLRVIQVLRFRADSYVVDREIRVENRHRVPLSAGLALNWTAPVERPKEQEESFKGPRPLYVVRLESGSFWARRENLAQAEDVVGAGRWAAFESAMAPVGANGVYLTAVVPVTPDVKVTEARIPDPTGKEGKPPKAAEIGVRITLAALGPGQAWQGRMRSYLGPMEYDRLKALGVGLERAIYFGGFPFPEAWAQKWGAPTIPMEWIVVPTLEFMHWLYSYTRNYGVVIILLTVLIKLLFFPLTVKSMTSMKAMQALQPQINALRSKYKNDAQRIQQETMALYRQHKVNPVGGCLPMIVQIPVFIALYVALSVSVELQNQPFICFGEAPRWLPLFGGHDLWICNLAGADPTYVLPILMGVSMFIQQKITPVMGDPRQAKMMLFMPILFTYFFLSMASGLVLYWTLSNVLQIGQQKYMERHGKTGNPPARPAKKA